MTVAFFICEHGVVWRVEGDSDSIWTRLAPHWEGVSSSPHTFPCDCEKTDAA